MITCVQRKLVGCLAVPELTVIISTGESLDMGDLLSLISSGSHPVLSLELILKYTSTTGYVELLS